VSVWLLAAAVLPVGLLACGVVVSRGTAVDAVVALELAGTLVTLELVLLAIGLQRSIYFVLPLTLPILAMAGALLLVRVFGDRLL